MNVDRRILFLFVLLVILSIFGLSFNNQSLSIHMLRSSFASISSSQPLRVDSSIIVENNQDPFTAVDNLLKSDEEEGKKEGVDVTSENENHPEVSKPSEPLIPKSCKIAVLTYCHGDTGRCNYWRANNENKKFYAELHGYTYVEDLSMPSNAQSEGWNKIRVLLKWLPQFEWIAWFDADTVIINLEKEIEDAFKIRNFEPNIPKTFNKYNPNDEKKLPDIVIAKDWNGINTGIIMVRNTPWTAEVLSQVWQLGKNEQNVREHPWREQFSLMQVIARQQLPPGGYILHPGQRDMNAYSQSAYFPNDHDRSKSQFKDGDFVVHFAGCHDSGFRNCPHEFSGYFDRYLDAKKRLPPRTTPPANCTIHDSNPKEVLFRRLLRRLRV